MGRSENVIMPESDSDKLGQRTIGNIARDYKIEQLESRLAAEKSSGRMEEIGARKYSARKQKEIAEIYAKSSMGESAARSTTAWGAIFTAIAGIAGLMIFGGGIFGVLGKMVSVVPFPLLLGIMLVVLVIWR